MATFARLHVYPQNSDLYSFNEHLRNRQIILIRPNLSRPGSRRFTGRYGIGLKSCRSFRNEDGGDVEDEGTQTSKSIDKMKVNDVKSNKGSKFWSSLKYAILGNFGLDFRNGDEYGKLVAKIDKVFSRVTFLFCVIF